MNYDMACDPDWGRSTQVRRGRGPKISSFMVYRHFVQLSLPTSDQSQLQGHLRQSDRVNLLDAQGVLLTGANHWPRPATRPKTPPTLERPCASQEGASMLLRREGKFSRIEGGFLRRGGGFLRRAGGFLRRGGGFLRRGGGFLRRGGA